MIETQRSLYCPWSGPRWIAEAVRAIEASRMILKKEKAKRWPNLTVGVMVSRSESNDRNAVGASLSMPIPVWDANGGAVRAAASRLEAAKNEAEQVVKVLFLKKGRLLVKPH